MKPSPSLGLKRLVSKIHPQLPIGPRESQQLLGLLTKSFRNELNREHPHGEPTADLRPTSAHIQKILSNPLLRKSPITNKVAKEGNVSVERIQSFLLEPVLYFEDEVAKGTADINTAKVCLVAHRNNASILGQEDSDVTRPILQWLWSSGLEEPLEFTYDTEFIRLFVPALVKEKKLDVAWRWFDKLAARDSDHFDHFAMQNMLRSITWAHINHKDIEGALRSFDRAVCKIESYEKLPADHIMRPTGTKLLSYLIHNPNRSIDPEVYGRFKTSIPVWARVKQQHRAEAIISISGPKPDPEESYAYIMMPNKRPKMPLFMFQICSLTAEIFIERNEINKAKSVIEYMQENFLHKTNETGQEENINRLEGISALLPT